MITKADILSHRRNGSWRELERIARELTQNAKEQGGSFFAPVLGGGTRLMLAMEHRISDDIDLFVDSPAWLPYVSPRTNDRYENDLMSYNEEGDHVKWVFPNGEIDFIVRTPLLDPQRLWNPPAEETTFALEPPLEVLAKKLFYRGWALTPRDLFDWYSVAQYVPVDDEDHIEVAKLLASKLDDLNSALMQLPVKRQAIHAWEAIKAPFVPDLRDTVEWAKEEVVTFQLLAKDNKRKRDGDEISL